MRKFLAEALLLAGPRRPVGVQRPRGRGRARAHAHRARHHRSLHAGSRRHRSLAGGQTLEPPVPIIVMSAGGSDARLDELAAAQLLDATIVLRKPFALTRLRVAIDGVRKPWWSVRHATPETSPPLTSGPVVPPPRPCPSHAGPRARAAPSACHAASCPAPGRAPPSRDHASSKGAAARA